MELQKNTFKAILKENEHQAAKQRFLRDRSK
jgi:hypothetical protein